MVREDNVIDNKSVVLKDELLKILPKTENASIAVGYFFISGLSVIIGPLKDVSKIRLLISNTTDKTTAEALIEGFHSVRAIRSKIAENDFVNMARKTTVIADSKDNIKESLEHMDQTTADKAVIKTLIGMMKSRKLEVKVYPKEKLHAKTYIFQPKDTSFAQGIGIVGSSNLSIAGISQNSELNLKTYHSPDINQLLKWFEELWNDGLEFTEDFDLILEKSWAGRTYSPRELFLKAAYLEYRDKLEGQHEIDPIWQTRFPKLFSFQKNAVNQGLAMFESHGGVIIGDVVGLGKTYVGTVLLKYLELQDYRPLVICPPPLVSMWEKFCEDYEVDAKVLSRGKLARESFELYKDYRYKSRDLVLIDESHHFRNSGSRQYENLLHFMQAQEAKAILLTATPFSNTATDIKNQIMLFHQTPKTSIPPANETDLDKYFKRVEKGDADLVDLLKNIMIRRTRRYVLNQWGMTDGSGRKYLQVGNKNKYFPQRKMETERYDINKVYQRKYDDIVGYLDKEHLTFARYSLGRYLTKDYEKIELYKDLGRAGKKLVGLIKTLLLKRMESSLEAFQKSIQHYINTHKIFLALLEEKIIPIGDVSYKTMYEIARSDPDSINDPDTIEEFRKAAQEAGETKYRFEAFKIDELTVDIQNDIVTFEKIDGLIHRITWKTDDKLHRLQKLLDKYSGKKVLVFSEFADTTKYLYEHLEWNGKKARVDASAGNSINYARRFDPDNNPVVPRPKKSDEISLLIATDVLAEGVNLQAGQVVINYDFHWNPTRLIQRAGRVDRIGSKNIFITVHNFLLAPEMRNDLRLEEYVDMKIDSIQRIIGEDYKILKEEEKINAEDIYAIYRGDDSILDREGKNPLEPSRFEKILLDVQVNEPEFWEELRAIPNGIQGSSRNAGSNGQLLLVCEIGSKKGVPVRKHYLISPEEKIKEIRAQKALEILESCDEVAYLTPPNYDKLVSVGWRKFIEDSEQIRARASSVELNASQRWVIAKLMTIASIEEFSNQKKTLERLQKAYSIPILKRKLIKELRSIQKGEMNDSEILQHLSQLYRDYSLQNQTKQNEEEIRFLRILYSKYVGRSEIG